MNTYSQKPSEVTRNWFIVDAEGAVLGRLATVIAEKLIGKQKPSYTPHIDGGDHVVVINSEKVKVTGAKLTQKSYYRHSGHAGGLKSKTLEQLLATTPEKVIIFAVSGMLPDNKLKPGRLSRLKVYKGAEHPHTAQSPETIGVFK